MLLISLKNINKTLFRATSIYSLVFTRIAFGLLMIYQTYHTIFYTDIIKRNILISKFHFKFYGFEWVNILPGNGMYWCFYTLLFLATLITLGAFYRIAIILYTIIFTYVFFIDQAYYLNHFYLEILLAILLCFMPAHRYFSLDSYWNPKIRTTVISFWPVFLMRAQKEIFLFYAGFVKINYEWLHGMPLKIWLSGGSKIPLLDYLFKLEWMPYIASYGTIILHLVGAPLLLWKPTRIYIFCIYCVFHLVNSSTFEIGVFPFLAIVATTIFFEPDWPAKIFKLPQEPKSHFHPPSLRIKKLLFFYLHYR